jgi:hypothetical protein
MKRNHVPHATPVHTASLGAALLLAVGCATPGPRAPTLPDFSASAQAEHFYGHGAITGPHGEDYGHYEVLAKRILDVERSQIIELVVDTSRGHPEDYVVTNRVTGSTYTFADPDGAFTGTGKLSGEPWNWDSWTATFKMAKDGSTVDIHDMKTSEGVRAEKKVVSSDGKLVVNITETLGLLSADDFLRRYQKMHGH